MYARGDCAAAKRLFDEIERAILEGIDSHLDVTLTGHDEDRCWIVLGIEHFEDVES